MNKLSINFSITFFYIRIKREKILAFVAFWSHHNSTTLPENRDLSIH